MRGPGDDAGIVERIMSGIVIDLTGAEAGAAGQKTGGGKVERAQSRYRGGGATVSHRRHRDGANITVRG